MLRDGRRLVALTGTFVGRRCRIAVRSLAEHPSFPTLPSPTKRYFRKCPDSVLESERLKAFDILFDLDISKNMLFSLTQNRAGCCLTTSKARYYNKNRFHRCSRLQMQAVRWGDTLFAELLERDRFKEKLEDDN